MEGRGRTEQQPDFGALDARERRVADRDGDTRAKRLWLRLLTGYRPEPEPGGRERREAWRPDPERAGVCCSGGGIRSASYNLGVLQHLQEEGKLEDVAYLSAVSGGAYIAAAVTLARRTAEDPFAPGSPEEEYLRNRTTYLAPRGADAVFFIYRMLLGLAINLVLLALAIGIPALVVGLVLRAQGPTGAGAGVPTPDWAPWAVGGVAALSLVLALYYVVRRFSSARKHRIWAWLRPRLTSSSRPSAPEISRLFVKTWAVRLLALAALLAFALLLVPQLVIWLRELSGSSGDVASTQGGVSVAVPAASIATVVAALVAQLRAKSPREVAEGAGAVAKAVSALPAKARGALIAVAATVAVPLLGTAWVVLVVHWAVGRGGAGPVWGLLIAAALVLGLLYFWADLTSWSLHPFYRSRLASVFALKRDGDGRARALDPYAEIPEIADAQPPDSSPPASVPRPPPWPTLLVCAAANVSDPGATPHGRRVTSFTFSAEEIGGPLVGYVPTREYEKGVQNVRGDVMTAVAVSGAALSPSMGKLTYPAGRALLALANVRLGVWLPNPRNARPSRRPNPRNAKGSGDADPPEPAVRPRPGYLLREMLGLNTVRGRYLFVTDGGHYENLGLVELLRRGCTRVYCFDAGGGEGVGEALGDAIALARSELGVEIEGVDASELEPDDDGVSPRDWLTATIRFPASSDGAEGPTGTLIYLRQLVTPGAPHDVHAHAANDPDFPHDPTTDQFLTGQSFESYRALGRLAAQHALDELPLA
jgi:hypothetical protein